MVKHIIVSRNPWPGCVDFAYTAHLSCDFNKVAGGPNEDEAIENLCEAYPEALGLPIFGRGPRAGLNRREKREDAAAALGFIALVVLAALTILCLLGLRELFPVR